MPLDDDGLSHRDLRDRDLYLDPPSQREAVHLGGQKMARRVGNIASLTQAFHKDAFMYGFTNGKLLGGPIKNLYGTGGCWHGGSHAGSSEAYNCYKIIAAEHGLGKPWEEPGYGWQPRLI